MRQILFDIAKSIEKTLTIDRENWGSFVKMGASGSATNYIDEIAERAALKYIDEHNIEVNILSEECGYIDKGAKKTVVIDPVDGTLNAINGLPFYSVSLAIGENDLSGVEYGLVYNLVSKDVYYAERGKGAYFNYKKLVQVKKTSINFDEDTIILFLGNRATEDSLKLASKFRHVRAFNSAALEICFVAQGAVSIFYFQHRKSGLRIVDIAAATLILRESGGELYNLSTGEILNIKLDLQDRQPLVALCSPEIKDEFFRIIKS